MRVYETQLPGVGTRYTMEFEEGNQFTVVIHNDGTREAFWKETIDEDSEQLFEVPTQQARKIAEIFDGTYFHPVEEDLDEALSDARIRWIHVADDSPITGKTLRETAIRSRTGVSVIAIQRGQKTISNPAAETRIQADDVLVAVGSEDAHTELKKRL